MEVNGKKRGEKRKKGCICIMMEQESQDEENQTQVGSEIQIEYQVFLGHCKYSVIYYNN